VNKEAAAESHDAILQYLDRRIGKRNILFNKEPFLPTVSMWNTIPIVFGKAHVDPRFFVGEGIESELNRIAPLSENGGAIIGELAESQVETTGHAKLMAKKVYSIDTAKRMFKEGLISQETLDRSKAALKTAMALMEEGKLSHSTGMICPDDGDKLVGLVQPNHVLDFEETLTDRPLDPGAVILNKETENVTDGADKAVGDGAAAVIQTTLDDIGKVLRKAWPAAAAKTNQVTVVDPGTMNTPDGESLESQIENVRRALSETIALRYPDGTPRSVWIVMTLPDQVIWQHPDSEKYYTTPYTLAEDGTVSFGQPAEVEQAYVVKQAGTVITNMTAEDLDTIVKRNKMGTETAPKTETDETIAKLQKEKDDELAAKNQQITQLQKQVDDMQAEQEKIRLQKEDADWDQLKKTIIAPGLVKDPKDEADLRKLQKEDNAAFIRKIMENRPTGTRQEGQVHTQGPTGTDGDDAETKKAATLATIRELRASTGRIGRR
jgi:hypothetical protein